MISYNFCRLVTNGLLHPLLIEGCRQQNKSWHLIRHLEYFMRGSSSRKTVKLYPSVTVNTNNKKPLLLTNSSYSTQHPNVKIITFCGILGFFFGKEEEKEPELILTMKKAVVAMQKEEFSLAEKLLHIALKMAQEQQNSDAITYIYDLMANVAFEQGLWSKAEKLFISVMQRELADGRAKDDMKIIHISLKLAKTYESLNDFVKAEQGFQFCRDSLKSRMEETSNETDVLVLWAMTLDWYARFLQQRNRLNEALVNYKKAYEICVLVNGEVHEQSVILLNDIGTVTYLKGDKEAAMEYMNKAIEVGKHLPNMEDFSSVYVNLGNIYLQQGMLEEAKKSCTEGHQNATRHKNNEGLKEANICLEEIEKVFNK